MTLRRLTSSGFVAIITAAAVYAAAFAWKAAAGADLTEYVAVLVILGLIFPLAAWLTTLGARRGETVDAARPAEVWVTLALVAVVALTLIPGPTGIIEPFVSAAASPLLHEALVVGVKLLLFVLLPGLVLWSVFGRRLNDFGLGASLVGPWRALLVFAVFAALFTGVQLLLSEDAAPFLEGRFSLETLAVIAPLTFLWMSVEAGLVEEFLFRAVLQERIALALKSPLAGVLIGTLIFGLAHAPGLALRGDGVSWPDALAHCVLVLAPAGLVMAVLWMRTRNLVLLAFIHGVGDLVPKFQEIGWLVGFLPQP